MSQTVPDFTTAIVTIMFLSVMAIVAYVIKLKSGSLKKIIKKQNDLEVSSQLTLRNGYLAYVFKVGEENFFFVGHKSGRGSVQQINKTFSEVNNNKNLDAENSSQFKNLIYDKAEIETNKDKKPLQHVNISDLLKAHKKGGADA